MKPQPWSYSSLSTFVNCPRQFWAKYVGKTAPYQETEATRWGNYVHKAFELRVEEGKELPVDLKHHEGKLAKLASMPGEVFAERKIGFDTKLKPINWQYPDIWYRGVVDYSNIQSEKARALIVDYKTGKPPRDFKQLISNALHTMALYPEVSTVKVAYYMTKTDTFMDKVFTREEIPAMWGQLTPDLKQYAQAFKEDTWQPRPSGLCHGWCPVTDCEHWKPMRNKR